MPIEPILHVTSTGGNAASCSAYKSEPESLCSYGTHAVSCTQACRWFTDALGFTYEAARDGSASDWILDVVSVSFLSEASGCLVEQHLLPGFASVSDVQHAAEAFADRAVDVEAGAQLPEPLSGT